MCAERQGEPCLITLGNRAIIPALAMLSWGALAGSGISHSELTSLAKPLLEGVAGGNAAGPEPSTYVGGDYRYPLLT